MNCTYHAPARPAVADSTEPKTLVEAMIPRAYRIRFRQLDEDAQARLAAECTPRRIAELLGPVVALETAADVRKIRRKQIQSRAHERITDPFKGDAERAEIKAEADAELHRADYDYERIKAGLTAPLAKTIEAWHATDAAPPNETLRSRYVEQVRAAVNLGAERVTEVIADLAREQQYPTLRHALRQLADELVSTDYDSAKAAMAARDGLVPDDVRDAYAQLSAIEGVE